MEPRANFPFGPYPNDILTQRSNTEVEFVTPANRTGIGTSGPIAMTDQPISGVAMVFPENEMDVVTLDIPLPADIRDLAPTIITNVEHTRGDPAAVP